MYGKIQDTAVFAIGAAGYTCAEIVWRGWTHWTMALTGGLCVLGIHHINKNRSCGFWLKTLEGAGLITGVEFTVGCLVNKLLKWEVWDYSRLPLNICGQICPQYAMLWIPLAAVALSVSNLFREKQQEKNTISFNR